MSFSPDLTVYNFMLSLKNSKIDLVELVMLYAPASRSLFPFANTFL